MNSSQTAGTLSSPNTAPARERERETGSERERFRERVQSRGYCLGGRLLLKSFGTVADIIGYFVYLGKSSTGIFILWLVVVTLVAKLLTSYLTTIPTCLLYTSDAADE